MSEKRKSVAIRIEGGADVTLRNVHVEGFDIAVDAQGVENLRIEGTRSHNVGQTYNIEGGSSSIIGTRITETFKGKSQAGYSKPNGPALPAQCPKCKSIFPSKHFNLALPRFMVKDNKEQCPNCGCPDATLAEGLFEMVGDLIKVIDSDPHSVKLLQTIGAIAASVTSGSQQLDEAINAIAEVSPAAANILKVGVARQLVAAVLLLFAGMAAANTLYDFNEKYQPEHYAEAIFSTMSQLVMKKVSDDEYRIESSQSSIEPRGAKKSSERLRKHRNNLNNSTAIPSNIPVPIPRPRRP